MLHKNHIGFSVVELLLVVLVIGALFGVGGYVWSKQTTSIKTSSTPVAKTQQSQSQPTASDPFGDWRTYTNAELGFKFRYPGEWGTPSVAREPLNNEKYETNLPYVVRFSNAEAPRATIIPSDWKFTPPGPSEWNSPLTREFLQSEGMVRVAEDQAKIVSIHYSILDGEIDLLGLKSEVVPKINASQVEFRQGDSYKPDFKCLTKKLNEYGSTQDYATLGCYPETFRNTFVTFIDSFTAM